MTEALALYKEARAPRDYKREYAQYHSKPSRVAERSQRNKARRKLGLEKGDPREVDHRNPISNGGSNARSNLRAVSLQANRKKFTKTAADVYRAFIEEQKRITLEKKASQACDSCGCDPCDCGWGTYAHVKEAKKLTARARNRISEGNFALPNRRYPIHDITHARNALSMVARHGTAGEKARVRKAVKAKFPSIGK